MKKRSLLLHSASTASLMLVLAPVAWAETATPASDEHQIEEIVITAQKRTQKLSDVTVTASVVNEDTLKKQNVSDIADLDRLVPAVNLNGTFNGRVPLAIRGVESDSNEGAVGVASGVGIEVDGIPVPSDSFAANSVEDVTGVEILEGPQATLGGRTATSGLIEFRTHSPTDYWHASLDGTVTDDDEHHLVGTVSGPLTDKISFSLTGWGHYLPYPVKNIDYDRYSHSDDFGVRGKLKFQLTDDLDATLIGRVSASKSEGFNFAYSYVYPGAYILAGVGGGPPFWSQAALFPPQIHFGQYNTQYASPVNSVYENRYDTDGALILNYRLGDYTISSTTAYQQERRKNNQDLFAVNEYFGTALANAGGPPFFAYNNLQYASIITQQWSEEVKLISPQEQNLTWLAGVFYSDTNVDEHGIRNFAPAYADSEINPETATTAIYGHAEYALLDDLKLVGGLRFNYDDISLKINQGGNPYFFAFPTPVAATNNTSNDSVALVGDIGLKYQFTPRSQVYFVYTRGYAPKVYNSNFVLTNSDPLQPVAQTHIDSFEVGTKGRYFNNSLEINASLFDTIYKNFQIQNFVNVPGEAVGIQELTAAGEAETQGIELNTTWKPFPETTINFNGAVVRGVFNKYQNGPCYWSGVVSLLPSTCYVASDGSFHADISNKPLPNAPKLKLALSVEQDIPLGDWPYELDLNATGTYRGKAQMQPDQNPYTVQSGYALLNLSATLLHADGDYSLTLFVNNVTNTHYNVDVEDFWAAPWGSNAVVVQPGRDTFRYFGAKFHYEFNGAPERTAYTPPPAPPPAAPEPAAPVQPEVRRAFQVFFDFDKSVITDAAARVIAEAAAAAKAGHVVSLTVIGHTDTVGSKAYNDALSMRRADAVKARLIEDGLAGNEIETQGVGKEGLLVATGDGVREAQNRRAEIRLN